MVWGAFLGLGDLQPVQGPHPAGSPSLLRALVIPSALLFPRPLAAYCDGVRPPARPRASAVSLSASLVP